MKHLFLVRHAKSSWADESLCDRERPLNARGESQLAPLGHALTWAGAFEGEIYSSDATRALTTLEGILPDTFAPERRHTRSELYTFDYRRLLAWLEQQGDGSRIMVIGHNPALLELAQRLLKQPPVQLPTASFIHIRFDVKHWRQLGHSKGKLVALLTPQDYSYAHFERKLKKKARTGGDDPAKDIPKALSHQLDRLRQLERGVILGLDDEFLHQYRIAIRRSRAIAESVQEVTGDKALAKAVQTLKRHARATGPLRDLHVFLQDLPGLCGDNSEIRAALQIWFEREAANRHKKLVKRLQSKRYHDSMEHWLNLIESRKFHKLAGTLRAKDIRKAVGRRIKEFNKLTAELMHTSPDEDIHRLRKQLKRIRYLMELDSKTWKPVLKTLKARQKLYGRFQDLHVQIELLDQFRRAAPEVLPAALDGILGTLEERKADARKQILTLGGLNGAPL
ncbi:CHAD domain-containing protein [Marinobacter sp. BW6]|uniref:CHAD domain-containing protein n=1 Tax=Marinobacter sp. BW6 TaxID=2592624 RepID=UPI0011DEC222|nr:CHAD domain-containing protein [Marinobacter sp. BW6]TYC55470.1 CHAD domain-containing protein [Marinobacter sp. BW6]